MKTLTEACTMTAAESEPGWSQDSRYNTNGWMVHVQVGINTDGCLLGDMAILEPAVWVVLIGVLPESVLIPAPM